MNRRLGCFETAEIITNEHFAFNVVAALRLADGPSIETLKEVIEYLRRRHPRLRVHVRKQKKRYYFEAEGTPSIPVKILDREDDSHWQRVVEDEANTLVDIFKDAPVRVTYLKGPGNEKLSELVITFMHVITDAPSAAALLHELLTLCGRKEKGTELGDVQELEPLPAAETFFPPSHKGFRKKWNNFKFLLRQVGDEFRFRFRSRGCRKAPLNPPTRGRVLTMSLSGETSASLFKSCRKRRITANNLFNAATLMAVQKYLYNGQAVPLRNFNFADLRPYLNPPADAHHLGSYVAMARETIQVPENPQTWDLARKIGNIYYDSYKRGDKFCFYLLSPTVMKTVTRFKSFRMSAAAMSFTGTLPLDKQYGKIEVRNLHSFVSNFDLGPEYTAQVRYFDKQVTWDILYLESDMDHELAVQMADEIRTILESAVKEAD
jgi:hypothetical protein